MPNGAHLREWKERGGKLVIASWVALFFETFLVLALGSLYGLLGLGASLFLLNITLLVIVISLQNQISAIDGALRGVRDESTYSLKIMEHLRQELTQTGEGAGPRGPA